MNGRVDGRVNWWTNGRVDCWMDRWWTYGLMNGRVDE